MSTHQHRHLLQVARALIFQANMPVRFWDHAILMATHIINRLPTSVLQWKSPYELLYKQIPTYDFFKVFGCLCYATNTLPHKDKFAPRANRCCFIGYSQGQKAFKLYDLSSKTIFVSRDVFFLEHLFPFSTDSTANKPSCMPLIPFVF